ncbi:MAG: translation initiation factor IF-2 [Planctomycetaceae bacterium]|nr:MAG: translation initiation factor IF-2 [Planctomycetaceae bacterium]
MIRLDNKTRIFILAKELNVDSKVIIEIAKALGIDVKTALQSITEDERERIVRALSAKEYAKGGQAGSTGRGGSEATQTMVGVKPPRVHKDKKIRQLPAGPGRSRKDKVDEVEEERPSDDVDANAGVFPASASVSEPSTEPLETSGEVADIQTAPPAAEPLMTSVESTATPSDTAPVEMADQPEPVPAAEAVHEKRESASPQIEPAASSPPPPQPPSPPSASSAQDGEPQVIRRSRPNPGRGDIRKLPPSKEGTSSKMQPRGNPPMGSSTTGTTDSAFKGKGDTSGLSFDYLQPEWQKTSKVNRKDQSEQRQKPIKTYGEMIREEIPKLQQGGSEANSGKPKRPLSDFIKETKSKFGGKKDQFEIEEEVGRTKRSGDRLAGTKGGRRQPRPFDYIGGGDDEPDVQVIPPKGGTRSKPPRTARPAASPACPKKSAEIELPITVRSLSEALGCPAKDLLKWLMQHGHSCDINATLTEELALEYCLAMGIDLTIVKPKDVEEEIAEILREADPPERLKPRPPIVTILGHVDHGKTTLLDKIRSTNVAAQELGGITQHIAAYQIEHQGHKITFVDTPGHAAFSQMRARGANVTDIVVLVVAANDGVMPQTIECISHAREARVPIIVALNKIDLPDINEQRVFRDLAEHDLLVSQWGGDVEVVRTSGLTGQGISELLDMILLTADLHDYKANPDRPGQGVCLEAFLDEGRGPLAWLIVQNGSLSVGDVVLCGDAYGRIRVMYDDQDRTVEVAYPSTPVKVAGLDAVPRAGDHFLAVGDMDLAREIAEKRKQRARQKVLSQRVNKHTLDDIKQAARRGEVQQLKLIVKADAPGSLEALKHEIGKFKHDEVTVKVIHDGVGGVNEGDVYLAAASSAIIIAFHVIADDRAERLAAQEGVEIRRYGIIYQLVDDLKHLLEGKLKPEIKEVVTGRAIVLQLFSIGRAVVAGCRVLNGVIERSSRIRIIRDRNVLAEYNIASLRREKDDVREVREGLECGIKLEGFNDLKAGDIFEAYRIEMERRMLDAKSS